jgi:FkbM family methyltransferase
MTLESIRRLLRFVRLSLAELCAATVLALPAFEPAFVRASRALSRHSKLFGGLYWFAQESLIARLRGTDGRWRAVDVRGLSLSLDIADATGRYPYFYGQPYEEPVTDAILETLTAGDVFVDVGANIGYFATLAACRIGERGRVIAFEPHDEARTAMRAMLARNRVLDAVEIVPMAVTECDGVVTLHTSDDGRSAHSTVERWSRFPADRRCARLASTAGSRRVPSSPGASAASRSTWKAASHA